MFEPHFDLEDVIFLDLSRDSHSRGFNSCCHEISPFMSMLTITINAYHEI